MTQGPASLGSLLQARLEEWLSLARPRGPASPHTVCWLCEDGHSPGSAGGLGLLAHFASSLHDL